MMAGIGLYRNQQEMFDDIAETVRRHEEKFPPKTIKQINAEKAWKSKLYRIKNPEKILEQNKKRRDRYQKSKIKNDEQYKNHIGRVRSYYLKNTSECINRTRDWESKNPNYYQKQLERCMAYRRQNREKCKEATKLWRLRNITRDRENKKKYYYSKNYGEFKDVRLLVVELMKTIKEMEK